MTLPAPHTDMPKQFWLYDVLPAAAHPYIRLARFDRPIGIWLLYWPCVWSIIAFAPNASSALVWISLFALGAVLTRGAGCVVNDMTDRDFDKQVERTQSRPLVSGEVSMRQAAMFIAVLLIFPFTLLFVMPPLAVGLSLFSGVLVILYPFMKRWTWWPQAFLGLTFNWGALLGAAVTTGQLGLGAALLYAAGFFWTLGYDTIYAHQDKEDDALIGVKSTARALGDQSRLWIAGFYVVMMALLMVLGVTEKLAWSYAVGVLLVAYSLYKQLKGWDMDNPQDCLARFKQSHHTGFWLALALLAGRIGL